MDGEIHDHKRYVRRKAGEVSMVSDVGEFLPNTRARMDLNGYALGPAHQRVMHQRVMTNRFHAHSPEVELSTPHQIGFIQLPHSHNLPLVLGQCHQTA